MVNIILSKYVEFSSSSSSSAATSRFSLTSGSLDEVFPDEHILPTSNLKNPSFPGLQFAMTNVSLAIPDGHILPTSNLKIFSFAELKYAARNFEPDMVIGEGRFGRFFKGCLDETYLPSNIGTGMVIAVKKLKPERLQGLEEWQSEVNFLGRLSHPNLVKLLGYCLEDKERFLVYEFIQNGSWDNHLFERGSSMQSPPWHIRLKVAIGAARGLDFLHSLERPVIYGDFKASNILLDEFYNPILSDFGFVKMGQLTYVYAAPEYVATGHLDVKSDVYCFGVVLLETLTGQLALDLNRPSMQNNLMDWAMPFLGNKGMVKDIIDLRLKGQYPSEGAFQAAELTLKCLRQEPKSRPSMKEVVKILERIETIKEKPEAGSRYTLPYCHGQAQHGWSNFIKLGVSVGIPH